MPRDQGKAKDAAASDELRSTVRRIQEAATGAARGSAAGVAYVEDGDFFQVAEGRACYGEADDDAGASEAGAEAKGR